MTVSDPITESFAVIDSLDKRRREYKRVGWIYACRNSAFADPVFKIGQSSRPPAERVSELCAETSVYREFQLVYFVHVANRDLAEGRTHSLLQEFRVNPKKEFFQASLPEIVRAMDSAANMSPIPLGKTPRGGFLSQPLAPRIIDCTGCGVQNRIANVLVEILITCGTCNARVEVAPNHIT